MGALPRNLYRVDKDTFGLSVSFAGGDSVGIYPSEGGYAIYVSYDGGCVGMDFPLDKDDAIHLAKAILFNYGLEIKEK